VSNWRYKELTLVLLFFCATGLASAQNKLEQNMATADVNQPPAIATLPPQYVLEGERLVMDIGASDPDGDELHIVCSGRPVGASFADNGDGTGSFSWTPGFTGPNSADASPLVVTFWVSDGQVAMERDVTINVINRNRRPVVTVPQTAAFEAGTTLSLPVAATDADFEPLSWVVEGLPLGAAFDGGNPGEVTWTTQLGDSGSAQIVFIASDPQGAADTGVVSVTILAVSMFALSLDAASGYPGDRVPFGVTLDNKESVSSFNLLVRYDATILVPSGMTVDGTRASDFEYFTFNYIADGNPGDIRIIGVADEFVGGITPPLDAGVGPICLWKFRISSNISYSGMSVPVRFIFLDDMLQDDNTLTDAQGIKIEQTAIDYFDGHVDILEFGKVEIGDINLNGLAFEISDAIYFSNFIMNPAVYPMNPLQMANSDINRDGLAATIADLVALINIIVDGYHGGFKPQNTPDLSAEWTWRVEEEGVVFAYDAAFDVGAVFMTITTGGAIAADVKSFDENMTVASRQDGGELRILVYSLEGYRMSEGQRDFLMVAGLGDWEAISVSMASADGRPVDLSKRAHKEVSVPARFTLEQNYPNPFNPETRVDFSLPENTHVALTVFNVLGREVKILINDDLTAGPHSAVWDGTDGSGRAVASGVYYYRLDTAVGSASRKMVLLK